METHTQKNTADVTSLELLSPAGDWPSLRAALENGANAIYFGVTRLNMRDNARSFEINEIVKVMAAIHDAGAHGYLTLNTIIHDDEVAVMQQIVSAAHEAAVDAVICWDMSVVRSARSLGIAVHLSTQASVSNFEAVAYYASLGVSRIVLARECTLDQIAAIAEKIAAHQLAVSLEAFVHGALCVSISGRCFISEYLYGESANKGRCLQPCRRKYEIHDIEAEGDLAIEDGFVMSPKDICTLPFFEKIIASGITSFKIEGRMRAPEYVATVTRAYRLAIDACCDGTLTPERTEALMKMVSSVYNRGFSDGFYFGRPIQDLINLGGSAATERKRFVGEVWKYYKKIGVAEVRVRNEGLSKGQRIIIISSKTGVHDFCIGEMQMEYEDIESCQKGDTIAIKVPHEVRRGDKVFSVVDSSEID